MSSDASSEESSVREGVDYDETFGSGDESRDFSPSSKRETSAQSLDGDDKSYDERSEEVRVDRVGEKGSGSDSDDDGDKEDGDGDKEDDDEESCEGTLVGPGDNHPFLPEEWVVNRFLPLMSDKVFKELHTWYQIPKHISIHLPRENKRCYSGRTVNVGMYDAMFTTGLRLPLTALHRQLANFLGLSVNQIAPNA